MLKIGIVGLPNVGKSTLFNAITNSEIEAANYPFATIEPNVGVVEIKDERLDNLAKIYSSKKTIYNQITFVDIAGLVKGASKGEGLGNQFLSNIREVDAIVQVVRLFESGDIVHVDGNVDPVRDIQTINLELILSDIEQAQRWIDKNKGKVMNGVGSKEELKLMELALDRLVQEKKLSEFDYQEHELDFLKTFNFLTLKPTIYLANVAESEASNPETNEYYDAFKQHVDEHQSSIVIISAQIEYEISKLQDEEQIEFLFSLGLEEPGLTTVSKMAFKTLGLGSYFTCGPEEAHAWAFEIGTKAPQAAGIIHTDFEKGFIKAEVLAYEDLLELGTELAVKDAGKVRLEGKGYVMQDADIVHFRFNN